MIGLMLSAAVAVSATCDLERPTGAPGCTQAAVDALKMNDIQVVGTHNSYKMAIAPKEFALVRATAPKVADTLDYHHVALSRQLQDGARQLELDLVNDPGAGGLYAAPLGQKMVKDTEPYDLAPLRRPGFKVMHVPDIDYRSVCPLFTGCLAEIRAWSRANPRHVPDPDPAEPERGHPVDPWRGEGAAVRRRRHGPDRPGDPQRLSRSRADHAGQGAGAAIRA